MVMLTVPSIACRTHRRFDLLCGRFDLLLGYFDGYTVGHLDGYVVALTI